MVDHRKIIDQITPLVQEAKDRREKGPLGEVPAEKVLGLKYNPGQRVKDKVTGEEVIVIAGKRATFEIPASESTGSQGVRSKDQERESPDKV